LIAFTPLRTYIPGYTAPGLRKNAVRLQLRADSLEKALMLNTYYLNELKKVLNNEITFEEFNKKYSQKEFNPDTLKLHPGKVDSLLREEVANRERFQVQQQNNHLAYNFVNPVKGVVVNGFNPEKEHYGIDIALKTETPVKSIAEGRVIFAGWSSDTGNTIIINHPNDIISVYKHNKKLLRKTGDWVQAGEVVALSGNSGEQTTGPHLHFELWMKDTPVDPLDFLSFK
jgi:murein DD-endopeptidase MepM/ murein hydrolase activator NlpD